MAPAHESRQIPMQCARQGQVISYSLDNDDPSNWPRSEDAETLSKCLPTTYSDLAREVLTAKDNLFPVAIAETGGGDIRMFDIFGEVVPDSRVLEDIESTMNKEAAPTQPFVVQRRPDFSKRAHIHHRIPENRPLFSMFEAVTGSREIIGCMLDAIIAHQALQDAGELHGDVSLNTVLCEPGGTTDAQGVRGTGYLWSYEPAREYGLQSIPMDLRNFMSRLPMAMEMIPDLMAELSLLARSEEAPGRP